jgi:hypothetical protein
MEWIDLSADMGAGKLLQASVEDGTRKSKLAERTERVLCPFHAQISRSRAAYRDCLIDFAGRSLREDGRLSTKPGALSQARREKEWVCRGKDARQLTTLSRILPEGGLDGIRRKLLS